MRRGKSTTAHGRRERLSGRMLYLKTLRCMVVEAFRREFAPEVAAGARLVAPPSCITRRVEVMHLRAEASQHKPGDERTATGCAAPVTRLGHHKDIDGGIGGRGSWYVALGRAWQRRLRDRLVATGTAAWEALTDDERASWDDRAASEAAERGGAP